jgi:hypothetical protein
VNGKDEQFSGRSGKAGRGQAPSRAAGKIQQLRIQSQWILRNSYFSKRAGMGLAERAGANHKGHEGRTEKTATDEL